MKGAPLHYATKTLPDGRPSWRAIGAGAPAGAGETLVEQLSAGTQFAARKYDVVDAFRILAGREAQAAVLLPAVERETRLSEIRKKRDDLTTLAMNAKSDEELARVVW